MKHLHVLDDGIVLNGKQNENHNNVMILNLCNLCVFDWKGKTGPVNVVFAVTQKRIVHRLVARMVTGKLVMIQKMSHRISN